MGNFLSPQSQPDPAPEPEPAQPEASTSLVQAAPTPPPKVTQHYTRGMVAGAINQFEKDLGGRESLVTILTQLPADDRLADILGLIADPANDQISLSVLCRQGGITLADLIEATRKGVLVKPFLAALLQMAAKIQPIVEDVMRRAAPYQEDCQACLGTGVKRQKDLDAAPLPCEPCKGLGTITILPDLDRQKFALELARLVPKKGVDTVIMGPGSIANLGSGTVQSMTSLLKEVDRLPARPRSRISPVVIDAVSTVSSPQVTDSVVDSPSDVARDPGHPQPD